MRLGWVVLHVADVKATVDFYERAFGLKRRFVADGGGFAEMETGSTALAFAAHALIGELGFDDAGKSAPHGSEVALEVAADEIEAAWQRAVDAGAVAVKPLARRPWGQTVGYVADPNGFLVELCTPVGGA